MKIQNFNPCEEFVTSKHVGWAYVMCHQLRLFRSLRRSYAEMKLFSLWIACSIVVAVILMKSPFPPRGFVCFSLWSLNTPWYRHCSPWILSLLFERAQFLSLHKGAKLVWKYPSNKKGVKEGKPKEAHKWSINKVTTDCSLDRHRKDMFKGDKFLDFMWTMVKFVGCGCHQSAGI